LSFCLARSRTAHKQTSRGARRRVRARTRLLLRFLHLRLARGVRLIYAPLRGWRHGGQGRRRTRRGNWTSFFVPIGRSSTRATACSSASGATAAAFRARRVHTTPCSTRAGAMRRV
jgi:hypothetical protein